MRVDELFFLPPLDTVSPLGQVTSLFALIFLWCNTSHWWVMSLGPDSCCVLGLTAAARRSYFSHLSTCLSVGGHRPCGKGSWMDRVCSAVLTIHSLIYWAENSSLFVRQQQCQRKGKVMERHRVDGVSVSLASSRGPHQIEACSPRVGFAPFVSNLSYKGLCFYFWGSNSFCLFITLKLKVKWNL